MGPCHQHKTHTHTQVAHLFLEEERHAVAHLVSVDGGEGDVEEEAVEDGLGDPLQRQRQQQHRHADEDVGGQRREPGLLHLDDPEQGGDAHAEVREQTSGALILHALTAITGSNYVLIRVETRRNVFLGGGAGCEITHFDQHEESTNHLFNPFFLNKSFKFVGRCL